jgi:hypothetical protein
MSFKASLSNGSVIIVLHISVRGSQVKGMLVMFSEWQSSASSNQIRPYKIEVDQKIIDVLHSKYIAF